MKYKYTSEDGLAHSDDFNFVDCWNKAVSETKRKTEEFCDYLKSIGVKALHPDDGWVNRQENTIVFAYPSFRLDIAVGDKIALGGYKQFRIVEVVDIIENELYFDEDIKYKYKFKVVEE